MKRFQAGHIYLCLSDPAENCGGVVANFPARGQSCNGIATKKGCGSVEKTEEKGGKAD